MSDKNPPICIKCENELHQSICLVDNAGIAKFAYPMFSAHFGDVFTGYLCDACTAALVEKGILFKA